MATIPQQLIEIVARAIKAGSKSGKECEAYTREHAPDLATNHISHLYLAFKMHKRAAQFAPAIEAVKAGAKGTLGQIAKPYQKASAPRGTETPGKAPSGSRRATKAPEHGLPYGAGLDDDLAAALGVPTVRREAPAPAATPARRRRADPPPQISPDVYAQFAEMLGAKARKADKK